MTTTEMLKRPVLQIVRDSSAEFAKRLPANADATKWTMQLATAVQKNPELLECDAPSLLLAAYEAAELGVSLSPALQLGYLIPYKGKVQFQISWRGLVQRAYETGCVRAFYAEVVYANDVFQRQFAPKKNLFHAPADGDRGERIGAYALVEFTTGAIDWEFCDKVLIERHQKHSRKPDSLMWVDFWEEAWRKTPIRILAKRLPLTNPGMERLAEVIARDAEADNQEEVPTGALEVEPGSPLAELPKDVTVQKVGEEVLVAGRTFLLRTELPKLGARWDGGARVWRMPAARTADLMALCKEKNLAVIEVKPGNPDEPFQLKSVSD